MKFWGEFSYFLTTCGFKYSIENALTHRSDWVESSSWENFVRPNKKKGVHSIIQAPYSIIDYNLHNKSDLIA